jgi:hypothetical protein
VKAEAVAAWARARGLTQVLPGVITMRPVYFIGSTLAMPPPYEGGSE